MSRRKTTPATDFRTTQKTYQTLLNLSRSGMNNMYEESVETLIVGAGLSGLYAVSYTHLTLPTNREV